MAWAYDSPGDPDEFLFSDTWGVFSAIAFDTGWLPGAGDPIAVRFMIAPSGGLVTEVEASNALAWPPALQHHIEGVPDSGWFGLDAAIDIVAELQINIFGLYTGTLPLWTDQLQLAAGQTFGDLLLAGSSPVEVVLDDRGLIDPYRIDFTVFTGLDVVVEVEIYPQIVADLLGDHVRTEMGTDQVQQFLTTEWAQLPPPPPQSAEVGLLSTWVTQTTAVFALVIEPSVSLDTLFGDFELVAFPIPIDLVDLSETREIGPVFTVHGLPALAALDAEHGFGPVEVGQLANWELTLENVGALELFGEARIEGSDAFVVFPDRFRAAADDFDGVVVSFAPTGPGDEEGLLVLVSNDPSVADVQIPLSGFGWLDRADPQPPRFSGTAAPEDEVVAESGSTEVRSCGCTAGGPRGADPWSWLRRRRAAAGT